jgi:phage shock protein A
MGNFLKVEEELDQIQTGLCSELASTTNRYEKAQAEVDRWHKRAKLAFDKGEDRLAKLALTHKIDWADTVKKHKAKLDSLTKYLSRIDNLRERAIALKEQESLNYPIDYLSTSTAMRMFERLENKVMEAESRALTDAQIRGKDLECVNLTLESSGVDLELEAMKTLLLGGSAQYHSQPSVSPQDSAVDAELEALKTQLDQL